jgi:DNA-binding transcriptional regulator YhcF (GntR family)
LTREQPSYLRIVEDIRRRIAAGDLRPGDPVPSARRITQDWGVALATATRALATLNAEGLTRSVPGVATVVAPAPATGTPGRARRGDVELNRDRIVASAIGIADAEGLAQVSMRRIATDLGVATMSLYRHVAGKDELLIYMMEAVLGEELLPRQPPEGWRARLELSSRLQWKGFRRHPWLAPALSITRPQLVVNGMRHTEWALAALDSAGLGPEQAIHVHITLFGFVRGLALSLEPEAQAEQDTGLTSDEWMSTREGEFLAVLRGGEFPMMGRMFGNDFELDLDALFEFGLARLLDGLERYLPDGAAGAAGRTDPATPAT